MLDFLNHETLMLTTLKWVSDVTLEIARETESLILWPQCNVYLIEHKVPKRLLVTLKS